MPTVQATDHSTAARMCRLEFPPTHTDLTMAHTTSPTMAQHTRTEPKRTNSIITLPPADQALERSPN